MSFSSSICRSPSQIVSRAAALRSVPFFASAGPATTKQPLSNGPAKSLTTFPLAIQSQGDLPPVWFNSTPPWSDIPSGLDRPNPDNERKVKLGNTLRVLQERLPTLLQSPLPQDILSPNISLHLFPSTHPYLPTVSGRVAYIAALWTSPIAWNRVPIIGNLKLQILSERMTTQQLYYSPKRAGAYPEQLVVKWRSASKTKNASDMSLTEQGEQKLDDTLRGTQSGSTKKDFTGLFIFEFDKDGKVISHTIEHVDQNGELEKGVGSTVVQLTDWLLGGIKGREPEGSPMFQITDDRKGGKAQ
ncbi:uncharacterized protein BCR38DRAFT_485576 [Pseudomassariella vexata]|uniref:Chromosome transmission fidelity protein 4 n=1 Tax=Pseudomassariella vexata TaxID=1141098 RepID=A0A1Y2DYN3_9PEZI|nr:uncharacterized protein BCR38DRAFT_485576 [Pseudomassariella vexata]ORY64420.1 hypothetical protein BCR38DRAFT_485576 [Pseudomassariella vexata]